MSNPFDVVLFTDGACATNPGPGGWAALLRSGKHEKQISGGFRRSTNNRMELIAVIEGLRALKRPGLTVTVVSDSQYVTEPIAQGWLQQWAGKQFRKSDGWRDNSDLWTELLPLLKQNKVMMQWIRGHAGHPENELCDQLAVAARQAPHLPVDEGFEDLPARMVTLGSALI